jgi:hypothetical protein
MLAHPSPPRPRNEPQRENSGNRDGRLRQPTEHPRVGAAAATTRKNSGTDFLSFRNSRRRGGKRADRTPGSVPAPSRCHRRPSIYDVRCRTPLAVYPETGRAARNASCLTLLRTRFTQPARSLGLLVVSYTTVSPLPCRTRQGGLLSVALSRGLLRVGVTHRPALWSPDVPRCRPESRQRDRLVDPFAGPKATVYSKRTARFS